MHVLLYFEKDNLKKISFLIKKKNCTVLLKCLSVLYIQVRHVGGTSSVPPEHLCGPVCGKPQHKTALHRSPTGYVTLMLIG